MANNDDDKREKQFAVAIQLLRYDSSLLDSGTDLPKEIVADFAPFLTPDSKEVINQIVKPLA